MLSFNALGLGYNVLKNFRNLELEIISKYSILQVAKYMFSNCVCDVSPCFWLMGIISMFYKDYHVSQAAQFDSWKILPVVPEILCDPIQRLRFKTI